METHFYVDTETRAEQIRQLLSRYRYRFQSRRVTDARGCRWHFTVWGMPEAVYALLEHSRLPFRRADGG